MLASKFPYLRSSSSSWWIFLVCVHIKHECSRSGLIFSCLFSTPQLPFCYGWDPHYGSFFVFADVAWLCRKMKCLCCQGASPAGWDQVTDAMKTLCFDHPHGEELHSGVAHLVLNKCGGIVWKICKAAGVHHSLVLFFWFVFLGLFLFC